MDYIANNVLSEESLEAMQRIIKDDEPMSFCDLIIGGPMAMERYWKILQKTPLSERRKIFCIEELPDEFWILCDSKYKKVGVAHNR